MFPKALLRIRDLGHEEKVEELGERSALLPDMWTCPRSSVRSPGQCVCVHVSTPPYPEPGRRDSKSARLSYDTCTFLKSKCMKVLREFPRASTAKARREQGLAPSETCRGCTVPASSRYWWCRQPLCPLALQTRDCNLPS